MFVLHKGDGGRPFFVLSSRGETTAYGETHKGGFAAAARLRGGKPKTLFRVKRKSKNNQ
jgi:hypothetical protein